MGQRERRQTAEEKQMSAAREAAEKELREKLAKKKQMRGVTNPSTPLSQLERPWELAGLTEEPAVPDEVAHKAYLAEMKELDEACALHHDSWSPVEHPQAYQSPALADLATKALYAFQKLDDEDAELRARALLDKSTAVVDAYNVLAQRFADNSEQAFAYFRRAEEAGPHMLANFKATRDRGWANGAFRPVLRSLLGQANTLRKMGRLDESLQKYAHLERMDPEWHEKSTQPNFRYHIPGVLLRLGRYEDAQEYMINHKHAAKLYNYTSSTIAWVMNQAFLDFMHGGHRDFGLEQFAEKLPRMNEMGPKWMVGCAGLVAVHRFTKVMALVLDLVPMPSTPVTTLQIGDTNSWVAAVLYAQSHKMLWDAHPEAKAYLRKILNTFWAIQHLNVLRDESKAPRIERLVPRFVPLPAYMDPMSSGTDVLKSQAFFNFFVSDAAGIFFDATDDTSQPLLHSAAVFHHSIPHTRMLLDNGADPDIVLSSKKKTTKKPKHKKQQQQEEQQQNDSSKESMTALSQLCYNAFPNNDVGTPAEERVPELIQLLVRAGATCVLPDDVGASPVHLAANQGNWRALLCVFLEKGDELASNKALMIELFSQLCRSTAYWCTKGKTKCSRCRSEEERHLKELADKKRRWQEEQKQLGFDKADEILDDPDTLALDVQHSPYTDFDKCVDVLVKYGLPAASELEHRLPTQVSADHPLMSRRRGLRRENVRVSLDVVSGPRRISRFVASVTRWWVALVLTVALVLLVQQCRDANPTVASLVRDGRLLETRQMGWEPRDAVALFAELGAERWVNDYRVLYGLTGIGTALALVVFLWSSATLSLMWPQATRLWWVNMLPLVWAVLKAVEVAVLFGCGEDPRGTWAFEAGIGGTATFLKNQLQTVYVVLVGLFFLDRLLDRLNRLHIWCRRKRKMA